MKKLDFWKLLKNLFLQINSIYIYSYQVDWELFTLMEFCLCVGKTLHSNYYLHYTHL